MTASALVLLGAVGWDHPAWRASFYPEGLPDDWLLSYYNTQFQAVYLPAAVWHSASAATWAGWLHDTRDDFQFVLEPAGAADAKPASPRVVLATPEWASAHLWWLDEAPDPRELAQRITQHAANGEPLYLFSRSGNLSLLEQARTLKQVIGC